MDNKRNPLNEALPQVFNREGIAKKNPNGNRATNRDFARIMAKVVYIRSQINDTEHPAKLRIQIPAGSLTLNRDLTDTIMVMGDDNAEQPDIVAALLLNGWVVTTVNGGA